MNHPGTHERVLSTTLRFPRPLQTEIEEWARDSHPLEACGLLLGSNVGALVVVTEVRRARNLNVARARDRFDLDPLDLLAAENDAQARALEVVGIWHSHPDGPAQPSETDRARAWHRWSYVIVSVPSEGAGEVRSFRLVHAEGAAESGGRFVAEAIEG